MKKYILIFLIIPSLTFAFTFSRNDRKGFSKNDIKVYVSSASCSGAGISTSKLKSLTKSAIEKYWNTATTSSLVLDFKGTKNIDVRSQTTVAAIAQLTSNNSIFVGCNDSIPAFSDEATDSTLGVATLVCSGSNCRGGVALNAHANGVVDLQSNSEIEAVLAHEIGHAIGIGHTGISHNLMYYATSRESKKLGQDDIDAVSYLYPHDAELLGLLGSCGTINQLNKKYKNKFLISFFSGFFLFLLFFFSRKLAYKIKHT